MEIKKKLFHKNIEKKLKKYIEKKFNSTGENYHFPF